MPVGEVETFVEQRDWGRVHEAPAEGRRLREEIKLMEVLKSRNEKEEVDPMIKMNKRGRVWRRLMQEEPIGGHDRCAGPHSRDIENPEGSQGTRQRHGGCCLTGYFRIAVLHAARAR